MSIADTTTAAASSISSTAKTASGVVGSATKSITGVASSAESSVSGFITGAVSQATSLFTNAENAVASGVSGAIGSVFGDSSKDTKTASSTNTNTPSATTSTLKNGVPKSTAFTMNPMASQSDPLHIKGSTSAVSSTTSDISGSIGSLEKRFQTSLSGGLGSITNSVKSVFNSSGVQGLYGDVQGAWNTVATVKSTISSTVSSAESTVGGVINDALGDYRSLVGGLASSITGSASGLDNYYQSNISNVTDGDGHDLPGVPNRTSTNLLGSLIGGAKSIGCSIENLGYNANGAQQSMFAALLGISSEFDITYLLKSLINCNKYDKNMQSIGRSFFYDKVGTNANTANTLLSGINPSTVAKSKTLSTALVTNPNLKSSDTSAVTNIASTLDLKTNDIFGTGQTINGSTVWDSSVVANTPSYILNSFDGTSSVATMTGGSSVDTSSALMAA